MKVDLSPFRTSSRGGQTFQWVLELPAGAVEGLGRQAAVAAPAPVRVSARGEPGRVRLEVETAFVLECPCDRCLQPVAWPADIHYTETLSLRRTGPASEPRGADPGGGAPDDDDRLAPVSGDPTAFSLDDGLWQHAAFALPAKLLCRPDCRGLCPLCGADRNHRACTCPPPDGDPRLAVLAQWKEPRATLSR